MKHNISNFKQSGVAWPLNLAKTYENNFLEKKYFEFQKKAIDIFGKKVSINQIYYQHFLMNWHFLRKYWIM